MSVRSEITRISGEVSNQANLIAQIGEALEDKSADVGPLDGGSSASTPIEQNTAKLQTILDAVDTIPTSTGTDTSDATAAAGDILSGKTAYVKGSKVTGTIATKTASNLTASGATVTVPAGYYASQATKSVSTATQATPSISVSSSGLITASATQTAGYVSSGTKSATKQLTTQAAKTITPSTSSQTAVASGTYTTGAVTVAAIPSTYVKPTATKAATTYTPTTSNQTIAAGTYCSGAQTIKGDANLKAENIASGVSIFGVTGTHSGGGSEGGDNSSISTVTVHAKLSGSTTALAQSTFFLHYNTFVGDRLTVAAATMNYLNKEFDIEVVAGSAIAIGVSVGAARTIAAITSDSLEVVMSNANWAIIRFDESYAGSDYGFTVTPSSSSGGTGPA